MRSLRRSVLAPVLTRLDRRIDQRASKLLREAAQDFASPTPDPPPRRLFVPPLDTTEVDEASPFMQYATCSAADFMHPEFARICDSLNVRLCFQRKLWEYVYVVHHLETAGFLKEGARGVVFGVGSEPLPAAFAALGCDVVVTDAPTDIADRGGWREHRHSAAVDALTNAGLCDPAELRKRVSHRFVDMNAIPDDLTGFDFCWSACCFEHLGSLQHGTDFVIESVERCLRPGGIAVHTTEFNLSSNDATLETPGLSIYRRQDLEELRDELRSRGHTVTELTIAPDASYLDQYVDLRPFSKDLHLKLELAGYATTSVGLVIRKSAS